RLVVEQALPEGCVKGGCAEKVPPRRFTCPSVRVPWAGICRALTPPHEPPPDATTMGPHSLSTFASCGDVVSSSAAYWARSLPHACTTFAVGGGNPDARTCRSSKLTGPRTFAVDVFDDPEHAPASRTIAQARAL